MAYHSIASIKKLEKLLQDRFDKLISDMQGKELSDTEVMMYNHISPHRRIVATDVRVAVDDFATILKEIKSSLGKK